MTHPIPPQCNPQELAWWKASYSSEQGACVEVAHAPEGWMAVRDSKEPDKGLTMVTGTAWNTFIMSITSPTV
ncbi:DUF397 domain-containing protein [Streptomyces sp. NPDC050535]|uniref:DUF397 domain-containing protein n=1 Tax=Streptomyces sp. NPDC050535 TaxID=3365626 RepID=UPI003791E63C